MSSLPATVKPADLLGDLSYIAGECGLETACIVHQHFAGSRLWVPQKWREAHELNRIGEDRAVKLCGALGGSHLDIPRALFNPNGRWRTAHQLRLDGYTVGEMARILHASRAVVFADLARAAPPGLVRRRKIDDRQLNFLDPPTGT